MTKSQKSGNLSKPNWNAVQSLLDDESEVVRAGLLKFLEEVPDEGREFLVGLSQGKDSYLAKQAQNLIEKLGWIDGAGDFLRFIGSLRYELETGWFLLDRTIYPDFEASTYSFFWIDWPIVAGNSCCNLRVPACLAR